MMELTRFGRLMMLAVIISVCMLGTAALVTWATVLPYGQAVWTQIPLWISILLYETFS